jgi:hypothetical protein
MQRDLPGLPQAPWTDQNFKRTWGIQLPDPVHFEREFSRFNGFCLEALFHMGLRRVLLKSRIYRLSRWNAY